MLTLCLACNSGARLRDATNIEQEQSDLTEISVGESFCMIIALDGNLILSNR